MNWENQEIVIRAHRYYAVWHVPANPLAPGLFLIVYGTNPEVLTQAKLPLSSVGVLVLYKYTQEKPLSTMGSAWHKFQPTIPGQYEKALPFPRELV